MILSKNINLLKNWIISVLSLNFCLLLNFELTAVTPFNWTKLSPITSPTASYGASMAAYPNKNLILFGGQGDQNTFPNQTWSWDGSDWTQLSPNTSPSGRVNASMAYHPATNKVILFGGSNGANPLQDTWSWDGSEWTQLSLSTSPSERFGAAMDIDKTGQLILYGGLDSNNAPLNDTWSWNGSNWNQLLLSSLSNPHSLSSMAYDLATEQLILFGGEDLGIFLDATWTWNGSDWNHLSPSNSPSRRISSMAYDPIAGQLILFGGYDGKNYFQDTWSWDGSNWTQSSPSSSPSARAGASMAYDSTTEQLILFGGVAGGPALNDTWIGEVLPPTVTEISPTIGSISGGTLVTITGTNFTPTATVIFGTTLATSITYLSPTEIRAVSPVGTGTIDVTVTTGGGTSVINPLVDQFTYLAIPTIIGISPTVGSKGGGTLVTITGTNFTPTATVNFGTTPATSITYLSPTEIRAVSPVGAGTIDIKVITGGGTSAINPLADQFTYLQVTPPRHVKGYQIKNQFATQSDLINVITWYSPSQKLLPIAYKIFKDAELTRLVDIIHAQDDQDKFKFEEHNCKKNDFYTYYLVSVDEEGQQSVATKVTIQSK